MLNFRQYRSSGLIFQKLLIGRSLTMDGDKNIEAAYALAKERYARYGVDTEAALGRLKDIPLSIHC